MTGVGTGFSTLEIKPEATNNDVGSCLVLRQSDALNAETATLTRSEGSELAAINFSPAEILSADADPSRQWHVLHTKSRREKKLAHLCAKLGLRHYLPLQKKTSGRRGRRRIVDMPLFPGYLFCCMDRAEYRRLLLTGHIANKLNVFDQEALLKDLRNINAACERNAMLKPDSVVKRGQRVRIVDGPLDGLEGVVRRHKDQYRLVLTLDCIQQAVACEIDIRMVSPL